jgi:hypothetical protein
MMLPMMTSKGRGAAPTSAASLRSKLTTYLTSVPSRLPPLPLSPIDLMSHAVGTGWQFRVGLLQSEVQVGNLGWDSP